MTVIAQAALRWARRPRSQLVIDLEIENNLLLNSIRRRHESTQWDEEVWILPTAAKLSLDEDQTLESDFPGNAVFESEMMSADVHTTSGSKIVVGQL